MDTRKPLFKGKVASGTKAYVGLPIHCGALGAFFRWLDNTSSATITLELTSLPAGLAPVDSDNSDNEWVDSGLTIDGPTGAAAGSSILNVENVRQLRARLVIDATADADIEVWNGTP